MKMNKKNIKISSLIVCSGLLVSNLVFGYNQNDVNKYINNNQCPNCDLSTMDFKNTGIYHSFSNLNSANLSNDIALNYIDFKNSNFKNSNLTKATITNSNFENSDFTGAALYGANFNNDDLSGSILTAKQISEFASDCKTILPDGSIGKKGCN